MGPRSSNRNAKLVDILGIRTKPNAGRLRSVLHIGDICAHRHDMLAPSIVRPFVHVLATPIRRLRGVSGQLAEENAERGARRTSTAAATLMIGTTPIAAALVLAGSIGTSTDKILDQGMRAELIVRADGISVFGSEVAEVLRAIPGVQSVAPYRVLMEGRSAVRRRSATAQQDESPAVIRRCPLLLRPVQTHDRAVITRPDRDNHDDNVSPERSHLVSRPQPHVHHHRPEDDSDLDPPAMVQLLRIFDLQATRIEDLLTLADRYRDDPHDDHKLLRGQTVLLHFAKPSTRTRLAFQTAVTRLGGQAIVTGGTDLQLGRSETIEDTARVASKMCAAVGIRTFDHAEVEKFAEAASIPVVNMLSDLHHPSQALADLLTIRAAHGSLKGAKVTYLGAGNNVCHSLMEACALMGVDLTIACPPEFPPDHHITTEARLVADRNGAELRLTTDPLDAVVGANVLYTDVWLSMGDDPATTADRRAMLAPYRVTTALMTAAAPDAIFMHCLPAHRGDEVDAEVIDGDRSWVFAQAENRLLTAQAILAAMFKTSMP